MGNRKGRDDRSDQPKNERDATLVELPDIPVVGGIVTVSADELRHAIEQMDLEEDRARAWMRERDQKTK